MNSPVDNATGDMADAGSPCGLPLLIRSTGADLAAWLHEHRERFERDLVEHGAVLFRGFDLPTIGHFEQAARAAWGDLYGDYGDLPREQAGENIYGSTPYPSDEMIRFHNESSHLSAWPTRISFHCVRPATSGGCTPLLDTRRVLDRLDSDVVARFRDRGLLYVRNFPVGVAPTWQDFFQTADRAVVDALCRAADTELRWRSDGTPRIARRATAVARHVETGVPVFFNQIQLHHISSVDEDTRDGLLALFDLEDLPRNVYYGDGSTIPDDVMMHVDDVYQHACVRVPWERGDMLVLDNMATAHARDPFEGARQIVVAMGKMATAKPA